MQYNGGAVVLFRYLTREIYAALLAIVLILLIVLISNQVLHYMQDAASGEINPFSLLKLLLVQAPLLIGFLLPLAFYLALLFVLGRWSADGELTAWHASGLSRIRFMRHVMVLAIMVALVVLATMFWLEPYMNWYRKNIIAAAQTSSPLERLLPGHFYTLNGFDWVLYTQNRGEQDGHVKHVFAAKMPPSKDYQQVKATIVTSKTARQVSRHGAPYLEFMRGYKYQLAPGDPSIQRQRYQRFGIQLQSAPASVSDKPSFMSTTQLWQHYREPKAAAEFQWRLAMPLSVLLLSVLAVTLLPAQPIKSRYSLLLPGLVVYFVYADLLFISRGWLKHGELKPALGLWWVHGLLALLVFGAVVRYFGWFRRLRGESDSREARRGDHS